MMSLDIAQLRQSWPQPARPRPIVIIADVTNRIEEVLRTENKVRTAILQGIDPVDVYLKLKKFKNENHWN